MIITSPRYEFFGNIPVGATIEKWGARYTKVADSEDTGCRWNCVTLDGAASLWMWPEDAVLWHKAIA